MLNNKLSKPTMVFHWLTAAFFIATLAIGLYLGDMANGPDKNELRNLHKSLGVLVMFAASLRLVWRLKEGMIGSAKQLPAWQEKSAHFVHWFLLLATIMMPLSGITMSIGGGRSVEFFGISLISAGEKIEWLQQISSTIHFSSVNIVIAILVLHVLAALKHQLVDKDGTLSRMLGRS
ncbi:cytochrome b [Vibrio mediterranei]|uniref:cytochrome b n=1 Tax=Vibrio mediterranei TaxID=689 RepID=UPI00148D056B|nr:cytochrome b [Vibrio mediterranei]NOH27762.1 cytochrome b [Vibrio mediterranei]